MVDNKDYLLIVINSEDDNGRYHLEAYSDEYSEDCVNWIKESVEPCWCYLDTYFANENEYDGLYDFITADYRLYRYDLDCDDYMEYYIVNNDDEMRIRYINNYSELKNIKGFEDGYYLVVVKNEWSGEL